MTKEQLEARGLVLAEMIQQEVTVAALRARVAKLEAVLLENYDEINALRARVAKLEAALEAGDKPSPQRAIQNDGLN